MIKPLVSLEKSYCEVTFGHLKLSVKARKPGNCAIGKYNEEASSFKDFFRYPVWVEDDPCGWRKEEGGRRGMSGVLLPEVHLKAHHARIDLLCTSYAFYTSLRELRTLQEHGRVISRIRD